MRTFTTYCSAVLSLGLALLIAYASADCPGSGWTGQRTLDASIEYTVNYKVVDDSLVIRLRAKSLGWLGFGLSESGHMIGADIVTAAIVNGVPRVEDRFTNWDAHPLDVIPPAQDLCQHWTTVCASEDQSYTDFILSRPLFTNDTQDRDVVNQDMFVIFAHGASDDFIYHGANRAGTIINFYTATTTELVLPADMNETIDLFFDNYLMLENRTQYVMSKFILSDTTRYVVAVEPIIRDADKPFTHHLLVHDCGSTDTFPTILLTTNPTIPGSPLPNPFSPLALGNCQGLVFAWALGGPPTIYPSGTGVKLGAGAAKVIILEFHLDNPAGVTGHVVTSGVRLYTAPVRENSIGTLILGNAGANFDTLPHGQSRVHREATCPQACTSTYNGPLQMVRSFPHMHSFGREIWSTIKDGTTGNVTIMAHKQYWNFAFQNQYEINMTLNPGDTLSTHCIYDTSKSTEDVHFGTASAQEMCMDFIMYWPKENAGAKCGWAPTNQTECKTATISPALANPIPDGTSAIPESVAVGEIPPQCPANIAAPATAPPTGSSDATSVTQSVSISAAAALMLIVALLTA